MPVGPGRPGGPAEPELWKFGQQPAHGGVFAGVSAGSPIDDISDVAWLLQRGGLGGIALYKGEL